MRQECNTEHYLPVVAHWQYQTGGQASRRPLTVNTRGAAAPDCNRGGTPAVQAQLAWPHRIPCASSGCQNCTRLVDICHLPSIAPAGYSRGCCGSKVHACTCFCQQQHAAAGRLSVGHMAPPVYAPHPGQVVSPSSRCGWSPAAHMLLQGIQQAYTAAGTAAQGWEPHALQACVMRWLAMHTWYTCGTHSAAQGTDDSGQQGRKHRNITNTRGGVLSATALPCQQLQPCPVAWAGCRLLSPSLGDWQGLLLLLLGEQRR
jgi:hypothetical protein